MAGAIDAGIPVNLTDAKGDTLLILAAYHGHADAVERLIARGADTDRVNDQGQTALAAATFRQNIDIVTALLEAGADPNAGDRSAVRIAEFFGLAAMSATLRQT